MKKRSLLDLDDVLSEIIARNPEFVAKIDSIVLAAHVAEWGERCPDYEPDCPACAAWRAFDAR